MFDRLKNLFKKDTTVKLSRNSRFKVCPKCNYMIDKDENPCHYCGFDFTEDVKN